MQIPNAAHHRFIDINLKDEVHFTCTITTEMVDVFAKLSGDFNPLHTDEKYAATTHFEHRIAHGMLVGGLFSRLLGMHLPGLYCIYLSQTLQFKNPIYLNTEVLVEGVVNTKSEAAQTLTILLKLTDVHTKELLVSGEALVRVMK